MADRTQPENHQESIDSPKAAAPPDAPIDKWTAEVTYPG
jgi:hypothetical protein